MCKRAARGAGLDWGLAEEVGKAARWLCACDLPGAESVAEVLTRNHEKKYRELAPHATTGLWAASAGTLCPFIVGAALSDRVKEIANGQKIRLAQTSKPLILAAYLSNIAKKTQQPVRLIWDGVSIVVTDGGIWLSGEPILASYADSVQCQLSQTAKTTKVDGNFKTERTVGRHVEEKSWKKLHDFMFRYLAPDTEESRISGAGASTGLSDND